jgi:hypothetical protein
MESIKTKIVIYSYANKVEQKKQKLWVSGTGSDAVFKEVLCGWFLHLDGSHEAICIGDSNHNFNPGDKIKITLEKVDAKSC